MSAAERLRASKAVRNANPWIDQASIERIADAARGRAPAQGQEEASPVRERVRDIASAAAACVSDDLPPAEDRTLREAGEHHERAARLLATLERS